MLISRFSKGLVSHRNPCCSCIFGLVCVDLSKVIKLIMVSRFVSCNTEKRVEVPTATGSQRITESRNKGKKKKKKKEEENEEEEDIRGKRRRTAAKQKQSNIQSAIESNCSVDHLVKMKKKKLSNRTIVLLI